MLHGDTCHIEEVSVALWGHVTHHRGVRGFMGTHATSWRCLWLYRDRYHTPEVPMVTWGQVPHPGSVRGHMGTGATWSRCSRSDGDEAFTAVTSLSTRRGPGFWDVASSLLSTFGGATGLSITVVASLRATCRERMRYLRWLYNRAELSGTAALAGDTGVPTVVPRWVAVLQQGQCQPRCPHTIWGGWQEPRCGPALCSFGVTQRVSVAGR